MSRSQSFSVDEAIQSRQILITAGTGGVGKTTVSAALALRAALQGKRALVITMDPARRLATSLGLEKLGDQPADLTERLKKFVSPGGKLGSFSAMMPDPKKTFEDLIHALSPSGDLAEKLFKNPVFQLFTKEYSGANEYMSLKKLYAIYREGKYDCIILDTPPSRNTLAFLDAPKLLSRFFEDRFIKLLVLPANKLLAGGMKKVLGILEKLTGAGFMTHLFDFASALFEIRVAFSSNLEKITELLESERVGFLVVAAPTPDMAPEIHHFIESIHSHHFHFNGVLLNRTLGYLPVSQQDREAAGNTPELRQGLDILEALQKREEKAVAALLPSEPDAGYARLPELARDVHSVEDLYHVAMALGTL